MSWSTLPVNWTNHWYHACRLKEIKPINTYSTLLFCHSFWLSAVVSVIFFKPSLKQLLPGFVQNHRSDWVESSKTDWLDFRIHKKQSFSFQQLVLYIVLKMGKMMYFFFPTDVHWWHVAVHQSFQASQCLHKWTEAAVPGQWEAEEPTVSRTECVGPMFFYTRV